jgi:hypothetical protein
MYVNMKKIKGKIEREYKNLEYDVEEMRFKILDECIYDLIKNYKNKPGFKFNFKIQVINIKSLPYNFNNSADVKLFVNYSYLKPCIAK